VSFSKAQILTLCSTLGLDLEDDTALSTFFDDTIERLALIDSPPFTAHAFVTLASGTATYSFEADCLKLLEAIMDDASVFFDTEESLEAYENAWRTESGEPLVLIQDYLKRQFTLFPNPNISSGAAGAEPLGEDYPSNAFWTLYAQDRASVIQDYYAFPVAFLTLAREYSHDSLQHDEDFSSVCNQVGMLLLALLGH
jgi:hypothetical protein